MKAIYRTRAAWVVGAWLWSGVALAAADAGTRQAPGAAPASIVDAAAPQPAAQQAVPTPTAEAQAGVDVDPVTVLLAVGGVGALLLMRRAGDER